MKKISRFAALMLLAGGISGTISAKDLYVSAEGDDNSNGLTSETAKKTLTALDAIIEPGDTVYVKGMLKMSDEIADPAALPNLGASALSEAGGIYVNHDNGKKYGFNLSATGSKNWKGITFIGNDAQEDGFSGDGKWGHFIIRGNAEGGFTFKNLGFVNGISNIDGGTIYIKDDAVVKFLNCVFDNNHPDWATYKLDGKAWKPNGSSNERGGCVRTESNCVVTIDGCEFTNNISRFGGAVLIGGTAKESKTDGVITNIANTGGVTITNSKFMYNSAFAFENEEEYLDNSNGPAITVWNLNADAYLKVDHCVFANNDAWNNGGAIYIYDNVAYGRYADITISNSFFYGNTAERGGGLEIANYAGGAMESKEARLYKTKNVNVINCVFQGNSARADGGAILLWGASSDPNRPNNPKDTYRFVNNTIVGNSTGGNGGHGAGYAEMSREEGGSEGSYGKVGNAYRYFYNNLIEGNYTSNNELSDFKTAYPQGLYMDNNYIGRVIITKDACTLAELLENHVNDGVGSTTNKHSYCGSKLGEEGQSLMIADADCSTLYDYYEIPGIALPNNSELATAGDVKWLKLADQEVVIPENDKYTVTRSGYDISKTDALGFARKEGSCAVGAAEYDYATIEPYFDGKDLPYLSGSGETGVNTVTAEATNNGLKLIDGTVVAEGAELNVYTLAGVCVARGYNSVSLAGLGKGVYVVKAASANGTDVVKVAK